MKNHRYELTFHPDRVIANISPRLHGHFAEHLGSCIYNGVWVGEDSSVPNVRGFRTEAVEALADLGLAVLRWPGGCFADDYHWRDGIGPRNERPRTINIHWGNVIDNNHFGTHEFIDFCRLIEAEPYLAGNVGSGTPRELRDWVEYCNQASDSALAQERASNGSSEPFAVQYWGVGNENWGCGGHMTPEEYAGHYARDYTFMRTFSGTQIFPIACGPSSNSTNWTRRFFDALERNRYRPRVAGYAMHYYYGGPTIPTEATPDAMRGQLENLTHMEEAIQQQRALLDSYDPERKTSLIVDEYGTWDRDNPPEIEEHGLLYQQSTIRHGIAAAMALNIFHRQADKIYMCNLAQTVNVLQALLLTQGDACIKTPTYHAFNLCKPHRDADALAFDVAASEGAPGERGLAVSASVSKKDGEVCITLVNPHTEVGAEFELGAVRGSVGDLDITTLHHDDLNACNTFENPGAVEPETSSQKAAGPKSTVTLPPLTVMTVKARWSA